MRHLAGFILAMLPVTELLSEPPAAAPVAGTAGVSEPG